jgi:hypothetical protein
MRAASVRSLADVMAAGTLPLATVVAYAREIATEAAAFHRVGRAHGALAPAWIMVGPRGAELPQPSGTSRLATPASDLRDFGLLLHQMLVGREMGESVPPADLDDSLAPSPETVRGAAWRLADRCRRAFGQADLRGVATELRLLQIMVNGFATDDTAAEEAGAGDSSARAEKSRVRMCPSCGSSQMFEAQHLTVLETLLAVVDLKTYRCYGCFRRFVSVFGLLLPRPETN